MDTSFNIVELIENNPITRLSGTYQNNLLAKIKAKFTDNEQQMFVASFYCFLNHNQRNDFVIDLDDVWKWIGFSNKSHSKYLLEKNFIIDNDYKILLPNLREQSKHPRGGHNKETIMLNIDTFKRFCLKAGTKKADKIHEYYIKLEETLQEVIHEESNELKLQLEQKNVELQNHSIIAEKEKDKIREKTILEQFPNNTQCVYYGIIDNVSDKNEKLIKFGNSNNLKNRVTQHRDTYLNFRLVNAFKVENKLQVENAIKNHALFIERQRSIIVKHKKHVELLQMNGQITFSDLDKIIKEIIVGIEFSPENYIKILDENKYLKKQLEQSNHINNTNNFILLTAEHNRLKLENVILVKQYNSLLKRTSSNNASGNIQTNHAVTESTVINQLASLPTPTPPPAIEIGGNIINIFKRIAKNKDGKYNIDGKTYDKLFGTRLEVWEETAYKTAGCLTKTNFIINANGKIVSKTKCIQETMNNRFEKYGVNVPTIVNVERAGDVA